jgi:hypothetical protein
MTRPADQQADAPMSYAAILAAFAVEIASARDLIGIVEGAVCRIADATPLAGDVVADLQQLDRALQQLAALQDFAAGLAAEADRSAGLPIGRHLQRIPLDDLRCRIAGEMAEACAPAGAWEEF